MYKKAYNRLPDNYSKEGQVNNEKFHKIIYGELEEIKQVFKDIKDYQDLDKAIGKTLDNIGKNVLELRNTEDDELYRLFIKIKIIANLSQGDIETINKVANILIGDKYQGVTETWNNPLYEDIAGLSMRLSPGFGDMFKTPNVLNRVKAGGVGLHWLGESSLNHNLYLGITNRQLKTSKYEPYRMEDFEVGSNLNFGITSRKAKEMHFDMAKVDDVKVESSIYYAGASRRYKEIKMEVEHV